MDNIMIKNKRIYNIDLLRIMACFMVIIIHVSAYRWSLVSTTSLEFYVYNFYDSLVRSAVPLFIMISGMFFLNPKKEHSISNIFKKNILKLVIIYIVFGFIYYCYSVAFSSDVFNWKNLFYYIVAGPYHFWYIPTIIGLYILSPILIQITKHMNRKVFYYLFVLFLIGTFLRTISNCSFLPHYQLIKDILDKLPISLICQYYSYFLLGYFLYNFDVSIKYRKWFYILGVVSFLCCMFLTLFVSQYFDIKFEPFYSYFSIFTLIEACALFLSFKHSHFKLEQECRHLIASISNCTLGIYVVHILVMNFLFDFGIINVADFNPFLSVPVVSITIFIISFIISYVAKLIQRQFKKIIK